jgi:zona occludens toxin
MIYLYSGTPGSGKSLHAIKDIKFKLTHSGNVICNFPFASEKLGEKLNGKYIYKDNNELTVEFLKEFAYKNHVKGKEGQTLIVIDECQSLFNPRDFARGDRRVFNDFFSLHRHMGFNVILITQNDRLIDRQIRCLIEYQVKHRKINNFKIIGKLLPVKVFACISYWYGVNEKLDCEFLIYSKKLSMFYDSYALFDSFRDKEDKKKEDIKNLFIGPMPLEDSPEELEKIKGGFIVKILKRIWLFLDTEITIKNKKIYIKKVN